VTDELLAVGRVARAHGIRGEVAVQPLTEVGSRFDAGSVLRLEDGRSVTVTVSRRHQHRLLVRFEEVADRSAAEALRGEVLLVPSSDAPPIEEGDRFWVHEVVGLEVVDEEGRRIGRVREVLSNPANDVWVVDTERRDVLVPAVHDVVRSVDRDARRVVIRELPGLREG
jgi:16S rRNA processing protein RimM